MRKKEKIKSLESRIERLELQLRHKRDDYDYILEYIKEEGEVSWKQFAKDFERCEHCGYDYVDGEGHYHYTDVCPEAFSKMCEDFIDETGNGNSTRSLIRMLHDAIKDKGEGTMREWACDYHHQIHEGWYAESGEPEPEIDFDKWLKQQADEGYKLEDLVWQYLWTYETSREYLNTWITNFWIEDFEKETGLKVEMSGV